MKKVTLILDAFIYVGLEDYLKTIKGINEAFVDYDKAIITIDYDSELISLNIIMKELDLYLENTNFSTLIQFDKHSVDELNKYEMLIKDACCEYCLKGKIEELLLIDGIVKVATDFDYVDSFNVKLFIEYNSKVITKSEIKAIEKNFNN